MVHTTFAHAQMNYHISQFGHWNQDKADTEQNWYTNNIWNRYGIENSNLPIDSSSDTGAIAIALAESDFYMVNSQGGNMQGQ